MIVYNTATTANGFLATPDDSLEWLFQVEGQAPDMEPFTRAVSVTVMGSTTYRWLLETQQMLEYPQQWQEFFGDRLTFVFSTRDLPVPAGVRVRVLNSSVVQALPTIMAGAGNGTVWVMGGGDLVGQFLDAEILDRVVMTLAPAFLSTGKPLLPRDVPPSHLSLVGARTVGQFVEVTYDVMRPGMRA